MQFISPNQLTIKTPESKKHGNVGIIITNPDGQQARTVFTYNPLPIITSILPKSGTGGTEITIAGDNFIKEREFGDGSGFNCHS